MLHTQTMISKLDFTQRSEAVEVLVRSFHNDPNMADLFPEGKRPRALRAIFWASLSDALPYGHIYAAWVDGHIAGVSVWLPPGKFQLSPARQVRSIPHLLRLLAAAPTRFRRVFRFTTAASRLHPREPHWYLQAIGVEPSYQGQGLGTRLLAPILEQADQMNIGCYLETDSGKNVSWYSKLGFAIRKEGVRFVPGGPSFWLMWRSPSSN